MPRTITLLIALLAGVPACSDAPNSDDAKKLDAKTKAETKEKTDASAKRDAKAKEAKEKREAKADAKAEPPEPDAKALDTNAQETNTPKNDTAGEVTPDSTAPTARPKDVPEDWQRVAGDVWSFWVPKDWTVEDVKAEDGSTKGDKSARLETKQNEVVVSNLSCVMRSNEGLPAKFPAMTMDALDRAKAAAKKQKVKTSVLKVEHDAGPQDALHIEYEATGDGTLVLERWATGQRALELRCTDESGKKDPANRKILDAALASLRWTVPD